MSSNKKYKLAYVVSHPIQYQAPLLKYISKDDDIDLTVLFFDDFSVKNYYDKEFKKNIVWDVPLLEGYKYKFFKTIKLPGVANFWFPFALNIKRELHISNFDAVWIHGWGSINHIKAILIAKKLKIPVLIRGESNLVFPVLSGYKRKLKNIYLKWLFNKISGCLAIGSWNKEFYLKSAINVKNIEVMPYTIDVEYFRNTSMTSTEVESFKNNLGITNNAPVILYASKLTKRKRVLDLVKAYAQLCENESEPPNLVVVGDGELMQELVSHVKKLGSNRIIVAGFQNQSGLAKFYNACDIFVLPSEKEQWGLVINEVMSFGKCVIVSNEVGCGPDLVREGQNGFIFKVGSVRELCECLENVVENKRYIKMGQKSTEIINNWTFKEDVLGLKKLLTKIVNLKQDY